ncbi:hypothetical protein GCM10010405_13640 [Streptomyces macrosporus]|uniref:Uncharacterized protein n=1 Tax=Streptomyces macrosporus TaxID=44032 RepID=A0ABN3JJ60_9ACTN
MTIEAWVDQRDVAARYGCPTGTLAVELDKRADRTLDAEAGAVIRRLLDWAGRRFREPGLSDPDVMTREGARLLRWLDSLPVSDGRPRPDARWSAGLTCRHAPGPFSTVRGPGTGNGDRGGIQAGAHVYDVPWALLSGPVRTERSPTQGTDVVHMGARIPVTAVQRPPGAVRGAAACPFREPAVDGCVDPAGHPHRRVVDQDVEPSDVGRRGPRLVRGRDVADRHRGPLRCQGPGGRGSDAATAGHQGNPALQTAPAVSAVAVPCTAHGFGGWVVEVSPRQARRAGRRSRRSEWTAMARPAMVRRAPTR